MATCAYIQQDQTVFISSETAEQCTGFLLIEPHEFQSYENMVLINSFDPELYDTVLTSMVQIFVIGLGIGLIIAVLRKLKYK